MCLLPSPAPPPLHTQPWNCSICVQGRKLRNGPGSPSESKLRSRLDQCSFPVSLLDTATPSGSLHASHSGLQETSLGRAYQGTREQLGISEQAQKSTRDRQPWGVSLPLPPLPGRAVAESLSRGQSESAKDG